MSQWSVGMTEQPDGSFKLSLLDDEDGPRIAGGGGRPASPAAASAAPAVAAPPPAEQLQQQRLAVGLGVVGAFTLTVILNHVSSLQYELMSLRRELKEEVVPLRSDLAALRGNVAALLTDKATLSAEQIGDLLALREGSSCGADEDSAAADESAEEMGGLLFTVLSLLVIFVLILPPILLGAYEWRIGSTKRDFVGFNWHDQLAYRVDYWLSNYPAAKSVFLLMITGVLIVLGGKPPSQSAAAACDLGLL